MLGIEYRPRGRRRVRVLGVVGVSALNIDRVLIVRVCRSMSIACMKLTGGTRLLVWHC